MAGIHKKTIVLLERQGLGVGSSDGQDRWEISLADAMPSGRGFFAKGSYYFPTTAREVVRVDVKSGAILGRAKTDEILGDLVLVDGDILSQSALSLGRLKLVEED